MNKRPFFIILLLIISISLSFGYNFFQIKNEIDNNQQISLTSDLANNAIDFNRWVNNKIKMLETAKDIVNNLSYDELTYKKTLNKYLNINLDDRNISQVYIGLNNGEFITGGKWIPPNDYDPRKRIWYIEAVNENKTVISSIYIDKETGDQLVTISSPLYLEKNFIGVISADIFLKNLNSYLLNNLSDSNKYIYIIDSKGTIVAHTKKKELVNKNIYNMKNTEIIKLLESQIEKNNIRKINYKVKSKEIIAVVTNVENVDWFFATASEVRGFIYVINEISPGLILFNTIIVGIILLLFRQLIIYERVMFKSNKNLKNENEIDFLTKIYNRRYFDFKSKKIWNENIDEIISVIMIDIDFFKKYNDFYGHLEGDKVLKSVCENIKSNIREEDIFARYGGEEFIIFLNGVDEKNALFIAEKIRKSVFNMNIPHEMVPLKRLTISLGVKSLKSTGNDSDYYEFILEVDKNLYSAKENGRNRTMCDTLY